MSSEGAYIIDNSKKESTKYVISITSLAMNSILCLGKYWNNDIYYRDLYPCIVIKRNTTKDKIKATIVNKKE